MSDRLPFELLEEIIKRLPVKSLLQFRSVSKSWKSLIESSQFITDHSLRNAHRQRLLVSYEDEIECHETYVSFVDDDDTFLQKEIAPTVPVSVDQPLHPRIIGTSLGLFFFFGYSTAVLWNPSIRKSIDIPVPRVIGTFGSYETVLGFGVCPKTSDPKIVRITKFTKLSRPYEVELYALSSGIWRTLSCDLTCQSIKVTWSQAVIDRFIYWLALDRIDTDGVLQYRNLIMSFDLVNENLSVVELPDSLATHRRLPFSICKLRDSLAILNYVEQEVCVVWIMEEHDVQKSFTKLFTFQVPELGTSTLGFRKNGELIMLIPYYGKKFHENLTSDDYENFYERSWTWPGYMDSDPKVLVVYEPNSKHIKSFEIDGINCSFVVNSYTETLLLLGHSD